MSARERMRYWYRRPVQRILDEVVRRRDVSHVRNAGAVLCNSDYTRRLVRFVYEREATVCYLGVDSTWYSPPPAGSVRQGALSVGALEAHKGFEFLIRSLGRIPAASRPALTMVGGAGHAGTPDRLRLLASRLGVDLTILTDVSDEQLASLYRSHAVFLFGAIREPFGMVLLEAMSYGLPVIAVRGGGVAEAIVHGESGLLTERDETAFAAAVGQLFDDPKRLASYSTAARAHAQSWTWERAGAALEAALMPAVRPGSFGASNLSDEPAHAVPYGDWSAEGQPSAAPLTGASGRLVSFNSRPEE
jgi:glycosyltransferase involved in cell wall biosynthesis